VKPVVWKLGGNTVEVWDLARTVRTTLPDGRQVIASPEPTADYRARALKLGYGWHPDPSWAMCREHDAVHVMLALAMDLPTSRTLSDVAVGTALENVGSERVPEYQWVEEGRVLDLQHYLNTGDRHASVSDGALFELAWEIDLPSFRSSALHLMRPHAPG
jgi:hypothetical protein